MADDERKQQDVSADMEPMLAGDTDETPVIAVPSHNPLPPPPEVSYTRPPSARSASLGQRPSASEITPGSQDDSFGAASHGAGLAAGTTFVVSIIAGAVAGNWIDTRWNHTGMPWATLVMTLVGAAAGFLNLQRILARSTRNRDKK